MRYLQSKNVDLVYNLPALVRVLDKFARYLYEMNIDEQEFQPQGRQIIVTTKDIINTMMTGEYNLAGVYLGGMRDTTALEEVFFQNPSFGVRRRNNQMFRTIGCDYCFWTIHFRNRFVHPLLNIYLAVHCSLKGSSS